MRRAAAVLLALTIAACGSSDDGEEDAGGSASGVETTTTESTDDTATDDTEPADGEDTTTTTEGDGTAEGSDPDSEYCQQAAALQDSESLGMAFGFNADGSEAAPDQVEEAIGQLRGQIEDLQSVAPDEIDDDIDLFAEVFSGYFDAVAEAGFSPADVDPTDPRVTRMAPADAGEINEDLAAADERLSEYDREVCGLGVG